MVGLLWVGFFVLILVGIFLDLGLLRGRPREIAPREAFLWTAFWIAQALGFSVVVYYVYESQWQGWGVQLERSTTGAEAVSLFLASYLMEKSLSLDNVVVMACISATSVFQPRCSTTCSSWGCSERSCCGS